MPQKTKAAERPPIRNSPEYREYVAYKLRNAPWYLYAIIAIAIFTAVTIIINKPFQKAFLFIQAGLGVTITTTLIAFIFALALGLLTGLGRISNNTFAKNLALFTSSLYAVSPCSC